MGWNGSRHWHISARSWAGFLELACSPQSDLIILSNIIVIIFDNLSIFRKHCYYNWLNDILSTQREQGTLTVYLLWPHHRGNVPRTPVAWGVSHMEDYDLLLTHWGLDKMDTILQTTFSNALSWMKMFEHRFKFHWNLFLRVQLTIFQHCFR